MVKITTIHNEIERGCGFRKTGLYLRFDGEATECGKFPLPLNICSCCGEGIKQTRSPRRINPVKLFGNDACHFQYHVGLERTNRCLSCPAGPGTPSKALLLWIGEAHYKSPEDFQAEAAKLGISRRLNAVPRDFEVGKDYVFLAHPRAVWGDLPPKDTDPQLPEMPAIPVEQGYLPGVFSIFRPTRIEYVINGKETDEELERLAARGLTLVKLTWDKDKGPQPKKKSKKTKESVQNKLFDE